MNTVSLTASLPEKKDRLEELLCRLLQQGHTAIAFSGGCDSSLLLHMLCRTAKSPQEEVFPVYIRSVLNPRGELLDIEAEVTALGLNLATVDVDEFLNVTLRHNPKNRCYLCKKELFTKVREKAASLGCKFVLDGTNDDDRHSYRPGLLALEELGIVSPLAQCGFTKLEVRELATMLGIKAASKPSTPCLATRFPYGTVLDKKLIDKVGRAEAFLRASGFNNVRVRVHGELCRIEIDPEDFEALIKCKDKITEQFKSLGFLYLTLDLEGFRSGSMDLKLFQK